MIEKIFYDEIIKECSGKTLVIGDFKPTIFFDVKILEDEIDTTKKDEINPKPILYIKNKKHFFKALEEYISLAIAFYYNGVVSHDNVKSLMVYVFSNATWDDLNNPVKFLELRKSFLTNSINPSNVKRSVIGYDGTIIIDKLSPILEAPYSFKVVIQDGEHKYEFPNIIYGIDNGSVYVYAMQNKFLHNNSLKKKINRLLFRINEGFIDDSISDVFNSKDVSMSFVASLIIFIDYLKKISISKIVVPVNLPIRYNSHYESYNRRINYYSKKYTDDEFVAYKAELEKKNKAYDDNVIMKLIRTFNRISVQGDVLKINNYPFTCGSELSLSINYDGNFYNQFCNELFNGFSKSK